jgi:DNA primase
VARIPDHIIREVQEANDIVEVISDYLPLKRVGQGYKALCPFHKEKTPSFSVHAQQQIYHCFGCGEGGTVFTFLMRQEGWSFPEAVRVLARRGGIRLPEEPGQDGAADLRLERSDEVNRWAHRLFQETLHDPKTGEEACRYLEGRGFTQESIRNFQLGLAPQGWEVLCRRAVQEGIRPEELVEAGLALSREGGHYDRFRSRLIFPISNTAGKLVGFGGRSLDGNEPKYVNSPESGRFNKRSLLYGLYRARRAMREEGQALVVEGYADCLMAHQTGIGWTVASMGTSLTAEQARLLRRYTASVTVLFDADDAGARGAVRGLLQLIPEGLDVKVATLPEGTDPADFLAKEGEQAFRKVLSEARDCIEFRIDWGGRRGGGLESEAQMVEEILSAVGEVPDPLRRELYLRRLSDLLRVSEAALRGRMGGGRRLPQREQTDPVERVSGREQAERYLALAALRASSWFCSRVRGRLQEKDFESERWGGIVRRLIDEPALGREGGGWASWFADPKDARGIAELLSEEIDDAQLVRAGEDSLAFLEHRIRCREEVSLSEGIRQAQRQGDEGAVHDLLRKKQEHLRRRREDRALPAEVTQD